VPEERKAETTYIEAITQAMSEEMQRDERVFLIGEDVGFYGGAFKTSYGLIDKFGPERVIDTPISEIAIIGAASGAALMGMRPIAEMQFIDFITCGYDMLVNFAAMSSYLFGRACRSSCAACRRRHAGHRSTPRRCS
jgi:2-oxoisovalerate dehydrogenase E1 component beta subunit